MSIFSLHSRRSSTRGFTLIELLVVVALIVLITVVLMIRQARFDSSTLLRSLSYSVALTVRSAQVYGTSVRVVSGSSTGAPAYGVYFNNASSYLLFADLNNNGVYDSGTDPITQTYQIGAGFQISRFCGKLATGPLHCSDDAGSPISWLVVYFKRPNPDALFSSSATGESYAGACVQLAAANDPTNTHTVNVSSTGEIAVGVAGSICQ
jgi:prepilin-type N-terminal cleavage/methylation domain-containing protein